MNSRGSALLVVGALVFIAGVVFSLQGADVITGSSLMSGNSVYIYVGAIVAIVGVLLFVLALRLGATTSLEKGTKSPPPAQQSL